MDACMTCPYWESCSTDPNWPCFLDSEDDAEWWNSLGSPERTEHA